MNYSECYGKRYNRRHECIKCDKKIKEFCKEASYPAKLVSDKRKAFDVKRCEEVSRNEVLSYYSNLLSKKEHRDKFLDKFVELWERGLTKPEQIQAYFWKLREPVYASRQISEITGVSKSTICKYIKKFKSGDNKNKCVDDFFKIVFNSSGGYKIKKNILIIHIPTVINMASQELYRELKKHKGYLGCKKTRFNGKSLTCWMFNAKKVKVHGTKK